MKVADEAEAVRLANDSEYGLSATVWTGDAERGKSVARQLEAGAVNINDAIANLQSYALPMGGWKDSGVGARWGGAAGLQKYCRRQAITEPRLKPMKSEPLWYPAKKRNADFAFGLLRLAYARGLRSKLGLGARRK
jgi:delta 1-pyrroline-5-carboxylate dehydrogenase